MRLKVIACKVFLREVSLLAAESDAVLDISYLPQGLYNDPDVLRRRHADRYGEDNADFLVETERESLKTYNRAALVSWPELDRRRYHGTWNDENVALAQAGETFELGSDQEVVKVVGLERESST